MSDSGDPQQDKQREMDAQWEYLNPPQIHSDETREAILAILNTTQVKQTPLETPEQTVLRERHKMTVEHLADEITALLAKEQTRLLDRVLEGLPKDLLRSKDLEDIKNNLLGDYAERTKELIAIARIHGHNMCLESVTSTIQKLKGESR